MYHPEYARDERLSNSQDKLDFQVFQACHKVTRGKVVAIGAVWHAAISCIESLGSWEGLGRSTLLIAELRQISLTTFFKSLIQGLVIEIT